MNKIKKLIILKKNNLNKFKYIRYNKLYICLKKSYF